MPCGTGTMREQAAHHGTTPRVIEDSRPTQRHLRLPRRLLQQEEGSGGRFLDPSAPQQLSSAPSRVVAEGPCLNALQCKGFELLRASAPTDYERSGDSTLLMIASAATAPQQLPARRHSSDGNAHQPAVVPRTGARRSSKPSADVAPAPAPSGDDDRGGDSVESAAFAELFKKYSVRCSHSTPAASMPGAAPATCRFIDFTGCNAPRPPLLFERRRWRQLR